MAALSASDLPQVLQCFQGAISQDAGVRRPCEDALASLENRPGFCSCLTEIVASKDISQEVRWLAAVYFKNSINKYWRPRREALSMGEDEKSHLRSKVLELVGEESNQIAIQVALIVAKIGRYDYPNEWPQLFSGLLGQLAGGSDLLVRRVYLVLHHVLKELSTKRLVADQKNFAQIAAQLYEPLWARWCQDTQLMLSTLSGLIQAGPAAVAGAAGGGALGLCERWLLSLKALRRLVLFGFQSDARTLQEVPLVEQMLPVLLQALPPMLQIRAHLPEDLLHAAVSRGCIKILKIHADVQVTHPWSFCQRGVMLPALSFVFEYVLSAHNGPGPLFERLAIHAMTFMHTVMRCSAYKGGGGMSMTIGGDDKAARAQALVGEAQQVLNSFFTPERLGALTHCILERYFPLTAAELESWAADPEEYYHESDMVHWKDSVRPCSETLYMTLLETHRDALAPMVVGLLARAQAECPAGPRGGEALAVTPQVLLKDVAYNAVGLGAYDMHDHVDFAAWLEGSLLAEIADRSPGGTVLRRRAAWVVGQWVAKLPGEARPICYRSLAELLGEPDPVVQLTAVAALRNLVDDFSFEEDAFAPHAAPIMQLLLAFLKQGHGFDSQVQVFSLVALVVERLGDKIRPCADGILSCLPDIWRESEGECLLRVQVVVVLQRLVQALGPASAGCYGLIVPMLQFSTDVSKPEVALTLLEDGMELWHITLRHAPAMTPEMMGLFPRLVQIMEHSHEFLQVGLKLVEAHVLLGGASFLQGYGAAVTHMLLTIVGDVTEKGLLLTFPVIDTMLQCFPAEAPVLLEPVLVKLVAVILAGQESDLVAAAASGVLARVLLQNAGFFLALFERAAGQVPPPAGAGAGAGGLMLAFVDTWLDKADSISSTAKRKLTALALCNLLVVRDAKILDRLDVILALLTGVWHETEGEPEGGVPEGYDYWVTRGAGGYGDFYQDDEGAGEGEVVRRKALHDADPVNALQLGAVLRDKVQECAGLYGEAFNLAAARVDSTISGQLQKILQQPAAQPQPGQ